MKLYSIVLTHPRSGMPILSYFRTSLQRAKAKAKEIQEDTAQGGRIIIKPVEVEARLTALDWIDLLEGDAPGYQDQNRTPVDFIKSAGIPVWSKEWE